MNPLQAVCDEMLRDLRNELTVVLTIPDLVNRYANAGRLCRKKLEQLRDLIDTHLFESKQDEIWLFKLKKPEFTRLLIYYTSLQKFYLNWPPGKKAQEEYIQKIIHRIETFFHDHRDFYHYHRSKNTMFDELYFLRSHYDPLMNFDPADAMNDPAFTTNYDHILGQLLAYEDLEKFLRDDSIYHTQVTAAPVQTPDILWVHGDTNWVDLLKRLCKAEAFCRANGKLATIHDVHAWIGPRLGLSAVDVPALSRNIDCRKRPYTYIESLLDGNVSVQKDDE